MLCQISYLYLFHYEDSLSGWQAHRDWQRLHGSLPAVMTPEKNFLHYYYVVFDEISFPHSRRDRAHPCVPPLLAGLPCTLPMYSG